MQPANKNALVLSLVDDTYEIIQLAESIDYEVVKTFIQHRSSPDSKTFVGSGKLDEIKEYVDQKQDSIELIIVNGELKPSQWFLLEQKFGITVYDRIKLILMIFEERAKRKEAQLQVQLAELEYEKPYVKELIHRSRSGEHPGLMAGGEYQVDDYFEMMKKQIKLIKSKLSKIEQNRDVLRKHRRKSGFYLVSLAGYTNAGKSSLLNVLTQEDVPVKDRLFSTLSTTTRRIDQGKLPILLSDTVGFISNLPAWIIKAFHSTLEEIKDADLILLVIDASDDLSKMKEKIDTSLKELSELKATSSILLILNKIDLINKEDMFIIQQQISDHFHFSTNDIIPLSIKEHTGINTLKDNILNRLPHLISVELRLPQMSDTQKFISFLYEKTYIKSVTYNKHIHIALKCHESLLKKIMFLCKKYQGEMA